MGVLSVSERKRLEMYLRPAKQRELARMVQDYMDAGAAAVDLGMPRGNSRRSDPTAAQVVRTMCPPVHIDEAIKWLDTVEEIRGRYKDAKEEVFIDYFYAKDYGRAKTCRLLCLNRRTFYRWQSDVIATMAIIAASKGIFEIQKCATNTGETCGIME